MKHQPNFENLRRTLLREGPPGPVPFFEIGAEPGVIGAVLGDAAQFRRTFVSDTMRPRVQRRRGRGEG